jgi:Transglycosylase-like domain
VVLDADGNEVRPLARVHRSRLTFALAVTLAALPVLVLDNMSATAKTNDDRVVVAASTDEIPSAPPSTTVVTTAPTASTTVAPAPTTTTVAPPTTEAPAAPEPVVVQAVRAPVPTPPPPPTTAPAPPTGYGDPSATVTWERMAQCESSGSWAMNNGNGYYGGLQFSLATWRDVGGSGYPHQASKAEQIKRGQILQARAGWGQWPHCARQLGYL